MIPASGIVLRGGRVVDGLGHPAVMADVLVQADLITAVAPAISAPPGCTELDVRGKTVMPGLIDSHCHISFDEPNWEGGKNVWWRFRRADGEPWGLAGLWNTWTDKASGEIVESYTMLTFNADEHPLMNRMHKPDPKLGPDQQDKRSVVPIELVDVNAWLFGTPEQAADLVRLAPVERFVAGPMRG